MTYKFKLARRLARLKTGRFIAAILLTVACNGGDDPVGPTSAPTINVFPDSAAVGVNGEVQFAAETDASIDRISAYRVGGRRPKRLMGVALDPDSVRVATDGVVSFKASGTYGTGSTAQIAVVWTATGGTVDNSGKYTAGRVAGKFSVIATATTGAADTAGVTVSTDAPVVAQMVVSPASATLSAGGSRQFTAVGKTSDDATVPVTATYLATGGTITGDGLYTAGQAAGTFQVIATDPVTSKADTAAVTIGGASPTLEAVELTPATVSLAPVATQQFTALARMSDGSPTTQAITWIATGGAISPNGLYTAAQTAGTYRVIASTSGKADTASVTITGAPPPSSPPPAGITILPGQSIQAAVNANPAGTTFLLASGTHIQQNVLAKNRNTFRCAPGAILDGQNTAQYAFRSSGGNPDSVTIVGCTITRYNSPQQSGAIQAGWELVDATTGWVVDSNVIYENKTGGIRIGSRMKMRGNYVHHNHMEGIVGAGHHVLVEGNEIAFNNYLKESTWGFEGGGSKFVYTDSLVVRNNYVHDNWGPGLWTDIDNIHTLYENNRLEDNAGPGIFHEISHDAVIRNNTAKRNGFDFGGWVWGGGIQVATSENVEIYGNTVENNKVGISVVAQPRGSGTYGTFVTRNINVHDNTVTQQTGELSAAAHSPVDNSWYDTIKFTNNRYFTRTSNPSQFCWLDGQYRSWAQWKGWGNDTGGSLTFIP